MFGRDPLLPLTKLLKPNVRYLGNVENILSLQALKNMYQLVVMNLKYAREKRQPKIHVGPKLKEGDLVLTKDHTAKPFQPRFKGNFRVVSQKGNQVKVRPAEGGETTKFHVTDIKKILPADQVISQLPDYNSLGRLTRLRLHPKNIPDLDWQLASKLSTVPTLNCATKIDKHTTSISQSTAKITAEVATEPIIIRTTKEKVDKNIWINIYLFLDFTLFLDRYYLL